MWNSTLTVVVLTSIGVFAGGLLMVAAAVVPAFRAASPPVYIRMHQLLDHYIDRYMPYTAFFTALCGVALVFLRTEAPARALVAAGVLLTLTVSVISQFGNVPLNKRVHAWRPEAPPPLDELTGLLSQWRRLHLARVTAGMLALLSFASASVIH